jgi:hypothetical protein
LLRSRTRLPGNASEFLCELEIIGGSTTEARAFVAFLDQSDLTPDEGTFGPECARESLAALTILQ